MESSEGAHWYLQCFVKDIGEIKGKIGLIKGDIGTMKWQLRWEWLGKWLVKWFLLPMS